MAPRALRPVVHLEDDMPLIIYLFVGLEIVANRIT
jgi:hypothetical protein